MSLPKRTRQLLTLLLLSLTLWMFFAESTREQLTPKSQTASSERPSAFTNGATVLHYEQHSSAPVYRYSSVESLYFEHSGVLESIDPRITLSDSSGKQYQLVAKSGSYTEQDEQLTLKGNVRLVQNVQNAITKGPNSKQGTSADNESAETSDRPEPATFELYSEHLSIDLARRFIYTDQAVNIRYNQQTLSATGLNASLDTKTLKLLNQVRGRYEFN